ncbi:hypothetical protein GCM10009547_35210 [Sporichthya brevicatena]|uniref:Uncharacterized protein n=1 Tax=Sporichthya brevicatena TaxID=171442 RepID=A0ABN1H4D8_9ACTN
MTAEYREGEAAEFALKMHRARRPRPGEHGLPFTFGACSEVVPRSVRVDLGRSFADTPFEEATATFAR